MNKLLKTLIPIVIIGAGFYVYRNFAKMPENVKERHAKFLESKIKNCFGYFDVNKDAKIEPNEFFNQYPKIHYRNNMTFNDFDLNKDKYIDMKEFAKVYPKTEFFWYY